MTDVIFVDPFGSYVAGFDQGRERRFQEERLVFDLVVTPAMRERERNVARRIAAAAGRRRGGGGGGGGESDTPVVPPRVDPRTEPIPGILPPGGGQTPVPTDPFVIDLPPMPPLRAEDLVMGQDVLPQGGNGAAQIFAPPGSAPATYAPDTRLARNIDRILGGAPGAVTRQDVQDARIARLTDRSALSPSGQEALPSTAPTANDLAAYLGDGPVLPADPAVDQRVPLNTRRPGADRAGVVPPSGTLPPVAPQVPTFESAIGVRRGGTPLDLIRRGTYASDSELRQLLTQVRQTGSQRDYHDALQIVRSRLGGS